MFLNARVITKKYLLGAFFSLMLLPMVAFASSEFKGTETVNINKANAATLAAYLKGVGTNKAEAIVKYRKANGKFKNIADLKDVPGIGDETYKDMKSRVSTSRGKSTAPEGFKLGESSGKSSSSKKKKSSSSKSSSSKKSSAKSSDSKSSSKSKSSKSKVKKSTKDKKTSTAKKKTSSDKKPRTKKSTSKKTTKKKKPAKKKTTKKKTTEK